MGHDGPPLIQIHRTPPGPAAPDARPHAPATVQWPAVAAKMREAAVSRRRRAEEQCELCGAEMTAEHGHLADLPNRSLLCVCRPCYLLFMHEGAGGARFRAVPDRYQVVPELSGPCPGWESLQIPIGLAFFFRNSATGRTTAFYPSPAGATESELSLDAWETVVAAAPVLASLSPDVEALLVRRHEDAPAPGGGLGAHDGPAVALIVPIDACYELVGRIRRAWRGLQGGDDVWGEVDGFFARARARAEGAAGA